MNAKLIFVLLVATMLLIDVEGRYYRPRRIYKRRRYGYGYRFGDESLTDAMHDAIEDALSQMVEPDESAETES